MNQKRVGAPYDVHDAPVGEVEVRESAEVVREGAVSLLADVAAGLSDQVHGESHHGA